jgi:hypothetical protein
MLKQETVCLSINMPCSLVRGAAIVVTNTRTVEDVKIFFVYVPFRSGHVRIVDHWKVCVETDENIYCRRN